MTNDVPISWQEQGAREMRNLTLFQDEDGRWFAQADYGLPIPASTDTIYLWWKVQSLEGELEACRQKTQE